MSDTQTLSDFYPSTKDFLDDLDLAQDLAETEWETEFLDSLSRRYDKFGLNAFFSDNQNSSLQRIINK